MKELMKREAKEKERVEREEAERKREEAEWETEMKRLEQEIAYKKREDERRERESSERQKAEDRLAQERLERERWESAHTAQYGYTLVPPPRASSNPFRTHPGVFFLHLNSANGMLEATSIGGDYTISSGTVSNVNSGNTTSSIVTGSGNICEELC